MFTFRPQMTLSVSMTHRDFQRYLPICIAILISLFLGFNRPVQAQSLGILSNNESPLEIEADNGLEWNRKIQRYIAKGNVIASRADMTLKTDQLQASYRDSQSSGSQIYRLDAIGSVEIISPTERAQGDKAVYDLDNAVFVMTGTNLKLTTKDNIVTARDSLEYWDKRGLAIARGQARATSQDRLITAAILQSHFSNNPNSQNELERIEAFQNVCLQSSSGIARADYGDYDLIRGIAFLKGRVQIANGRNLLKGDQAEFNLKTGISRLLSAPTRATQTSPKKRVKGILLPGSGNSNLPPSAPENNPLTLPPCP